MRLCVISGAAAKRALTLHCGRRAQALSRVDVPRTQAVEFGSEPGAIIYLCTCNWRRRSRSKPVRQEEHDKSARAAQTWSRFSCTQNTSATRCSGSCCRWRSCRVPASRPAKPCACHNLPAASRMPSGATAASMLQQLGGSERACRSGALRHAYTNLNQHWLACGRRKPRAVPSQGRADAHGAISNEA